MEAGEKTKRSADEYYFPLMRLVVPASRRVYARQTLPGQPQL